MSEIILEKLDDNRWLLPQTGAMRVPGIIYANEKIYQLLKGDESAKQVANVAHLPGIVNYSLAMPDVHWGYGFPIGGVAAFDLDGGIISPGGVGYDINCGCRLMTTNLTLGDIKARLNDLTTALYQHIPSGVGSTGSVKLSGKDQKKVWKKAQHGRLKRVSVYRKTWKQRKTRERFPGQDHRRLSQVDDNRGHRGRAEGGRLCAVAPAVWDKGAGQDWKVSMIRGTRVIKA